MCAEVPVRCCCSAWGDGRDVCAPLTFCQTACCRSLRTTTQSAYSRLPGKRWGRLAAALQTWLNLETCSSMTSPLELGCLPPSGGGWASVCPSDTVGKSGNQSRAQARLRFSKAGRESNPTQPMFQACRGLVWLPPHIFPLQALIHGSASSNASDMCTEVPPHSRRHVRNTGVLEKRCEKLVTSKHAGKLYGTLLRSRD